MVPFKRMIFGSFYEAADWQRAMIQELVGEGFAIRAATISSAKDFATKEIIWMVYVRAFPMEGGDTVETYTGLHPKHYGFGNDR